METSALHTGHSYTSLMPLEPAVIKVLDDVFNTLAPQARALFGDGRHITTALQSLGVVSVADLQSILAEDVEELLCVVKG